MFFEGTEKKFEIIINKNNNSLKSLRHLNYHFWDELVKQANAQIISKISNDFIDAYLLSESSLFVFDNKFIMITCGKTNLISSIEYFINNFKNDKIKNEIDIELLIYERKNENFPHFQHSNFYDDTKQLNKHIKGKAYQFGQGALPHLKLYHLDNNSFSPLNSDITIEILMYELGEEAINSFSHKQTNKNDHTKNKIKNIWGNFQIEDFCFDPKGYSINAIKDKFYYTAHVTPEKIGSYASFETNYLPNNDLTSLVKNVMEIFKPKFFDLVIFSPKNIFDEKFYSNYTLESRIEEKINCGYNVSFMHFFKQQNNIQKALEI